MLIASLEVEYLNRQKVKSLLLAQGLSRSRIKTIVASTFGYVKSIREGKRNMSDTASFTPVTVTAETLSRLAKEKKYGDLLALYMACVEISVWQGGSSIRASREFMMKRLGWGEDKLAYAKSTLVKMGLLEPRTKKNKDGTIIGHYILVKHIVQNHQNPVVVQEVSHNPQNPALDSEGTSTNKLKLNTNNTKKRKVQEQELISLVNKVTGRAFRTLPARGVKKTLDAFSLVEIESALRALRADDWHSERIKELSIDYLIRSTTIDKFLGKVSDGATIAPVPMSQKEYEEKIANEVIPEAPGWDGADAVK